MNSKLFNLLREDLRKMLCGLELTDEQGENLIQLIRTRVRGQKLSEFDKRLLHQCRIAPE